MSVTGEPDNQNGGGPTKVGVAVTDIFTGLYAANAIQGALLERHHSGMGQYIDLALLDVQAAVMANQASNYLIGGQIPGRLGNAHPNIVPYQAFATLDSHIIVAVGNDQQFQRFCKAIGEPKWADDQRYETNTARVNNRVTLCGQITKHLKQQNSQYWLSKFEDHAVPCGPINTIDQVFDDPQIQSRNMVLTMQDPRAGELKLVANPINYSRSQIEYHLAPPQLGNQTIEILQEYLEYAETTVKVLKSNDVI